MPEHPAHPWTFFYGSYLNLEVLREIGIRPWVWETAHLRGFDIRIAPRANLVPSDTGTVYGIVATLTHAELDRLYAHAKEVLGETYLPEAVLVHTDSGVDRPALCYISHDMIERPPDEAYVERIVGPARQYGFPDWYLERLESFREYAG